ncbi:isochorismatase family protein [Myxococcus xanthus]|nr:isochorismatase family protein [Myxococcus xanthus]
MLLIDHQSGLFQTVQDMAMPSFRANAAALAKMASLSELPVITTASVPQGPNGPLIPEIHQNAPNAKYVARKGEISAWDNPDFVAAVKATGKKWTEACLTFPALDALKAGYEIYVVADAVGGTSVAAHEAGLRRIERAGGKIISVPQLFCELQRDWSRKETVPAFMDLFIQTGGTAGIQFSYDWSE